LDNLTVIATNLDFTSFDWKQFYSEMYTKLTSNANNVAGNVGDCCSYDRTWYGRLYCEYYNPVGYNLKN